MKKTTGQSKGKGKGSGKVKSKASGKTGASESASRLIDARIKELDDWRGAALARIRELIREAVPGVSEEWKWGIPTWYSDGLICTGEVYKDKVKATFAKGARLKDPSKMFNSSLEGNVRRAIDWFEGDKVNAPAFKALVRDAAILNKGR